MASYRWRFSLRALFVLFTLLAFVFGMYLNVWFVNPLIPAFVTLVAGSVFGFTRQVRHNRNGISGAIIGGIVGANLAVVLHLVCGYTLLDAFEDEGLGLVGSVFVFAPFATLSGIVVGCLVSIIGYPIFWIILGRVGKRERV